MNVAELLKDLQSRFGDGVLGAETSAPDPWLELSPAVLVPVCEFCATILACNSIC